jgi:predicted nucleic acid-binding protein
MRVYLDTCVWLRPYDDQSQPRIHRETAAFEAIARMAGAGEVRLVKSEVLDVELDEAENRRPGGDSRPLLRLAAVRVRLTPGRIRLGRQMAGDVGLEMADALHLASAAGTADCFLTSDDEILGKAGQIQAFLKKRGMKLAVLGPEEFDKWQKRKQQTGT